MLHGDMEISREGETAMAKRFYCLVLSVLMLLSLVPLDLCATAWAEELPEVAESETVAETPVGDGVLDVPQEELAPGSSVGADDSVRPNPAEETGSALPEETTLTAPVLAAGTTASGQCGDDLTWVLDSEGTLTISGTGDMWDYGGVWGGYSTAPWFGENVTSVVIEDGVTNVGDFAFYGCRELQSVSLPKSVTAIQYAAFSYCRSLQSITLPSNLQTIGECAFSRCENLKTVNLPDSVTEIQYYAFGRCTSLASINMPAALSSLGEDSFYGCGSLDAISLPNGITSVPSSVFAYCDNLQSVTLPENLQTVGKCAFSHCTSLKTIILPDSVTDIQYYAFGNCYSLASITLPNALQSTGKYTFYWCSALQSISLPQSITTVQYAAFSHCHNLKSISLPEKVKVVEPCAFSYCENLKTVNLPQSVTDIQYFAFGWCGALSDITLPNGLTSLGECAFYNCESLSSITVPSGIKNLPRGVFQGAGLQSVTLPEGLETIGRSAFFYCTSLSSCSLPGSVNYIAPLAFSGCLALSAFSVANSNPYYSVKSGVLFNKDQTTLCAYPAGKSNTYIIPNGVTVVEDFSFYGNSNLHFVTIPAGVTDLGECAFWGCSSLESVVVPGSVINWGPHVFSHCYNLQKVTLSEGLAEIGPQAFYYCNNLQTVTIPSTIETIQDEAFYCTGLIELALPKGAVIIGSGAFSECRQLTTVSLPESLAYIGENAFRYCSALTTATYPNTKATWDSKVYVSGNNKPLLDVLHFSDSLTVTGLTTAHNGMTIQLRGQGSGEILASTTVKNGVCRPLALPDGTYTLSLSKIGYVPFDTAVTVANHALALGSVPTLVKKGDVNGVKNADGKTVDVSDMQCLYDYLATGTLTGQITNAAYFAAVADFNKDGAVNILDYQALYEKVRGGGISGYQEEIVIAMSDEFSTIDPMETTSEYNQMVQDCVFDRLFDVDLTTKQLVGGLVESYEMITPDDWRFTLKPNVKFHDGTILNVDDVEFTFERAKEHSATSNYMADIVEFIKINDLTFEIKLFRGNVDYPHTLAANTLAILSKEAFETMPEEEAVTVGTGPWVFKEFVYGEYVTLERFEDCTLYPVPHTEKLTFRMIPETSKRMTALKNGEVDVIMNPAATDYVRIENDSDLQLLTETGRSQNFIGFNLQNPDFVGQDADFRLAVAKAIDKEEMVNAAWNGYAQISTSMMCRDMDFYADIDGVAYDPDGAKALFAQLGITPQHRLQAKLVTSDAAHRVKMAENFCSQMVKYGIDISLEYMSNSALTELLVFPFDREPVEFNISSWTPGKNADYMFRNPIHSQGGRNYSHLDDPEIDALIDAAAGETNVAKRQEIYTELQEKLTCEIILWVPIAQPAFVIGASAGITGVQIDPGLVHRFKFVERRVE